MKPAIILLATVALGFAAAPDQEALLEKIAAYEHGQSREALSQFETLVFEASASPARARPLEARLVRFLASPSTLAGKDFVCRQLSLIGTDASVPALAAMLARPQTAEMARYALERIPGRAADKALREALTKTSGRTRVGVMHSLEVRRGGSAAGPPRVQPSDIPILERDLTSTDNAVRIAALGSLKRLPGAEVTAVLVRRFPELPPLGQLQVLTALSERADKTAAPVFVDALKSASPEVRLAALSGFPAIGNSSHVALLAQFAAAAQGIEQSAARDTLALLAGGDVDRVIAAGIASAAAKVKVELIRAAGERGAAVAADALLESARNPDREIRREAFRALRDTTGPKHVPALLDLLSQAATASDRTEAGRALAGVLKRSDKASLRPLLAAYAAAPTPTIRAALLDVMGQAGSEDALPVLRGGLKDPSPEVSRAALLALSDWPGPEPLPDLLALAAHEPDPARQVLALRGVIKLISLAAQRPAAESAGLLAQAMALAKQPEERRAVLALLSRYPCQEALRVAESALGDSAVVAEARLAYGRISRALAAAGNRK